MQASTLRHCYFIFFFTFLKWRSKESILSELCCSSVMSAPILLTASIFLTEVGFFFWFFFFFLRLLSMKPILLFFRTWISPTDGFFYSQTPWTCFRTTTSSLHTTHLIMIEEWLCEWLCNIPYFRVITVSDCRELSGLYEQDEFSITVKFSKYRWPIQRKYGSHLIFVLVMFKQISNPIRFNQGSMLVKAGVTSILDCWYNLKCAIIVEWDTDINSIYDSKASSGSL